MMAAMTACPQCTRMHRRAQVAESRMHRELGQESLERLWRTVWNIREQRVRDWRHARFWETNARALYEVLPSFFVRWAIDRYTAGRNYPGYPPTESEREE